MKIFGLYGSHALCNWRKHNAHGTAWLQERTLWIGICDLISNFAKHFLNSNDFYSFCLAAELSVISYFVLQISTFGTFFVVYSLLYFMWVASSVMCPLISEKTKLAHHTDTFQLSENNGYPKVAATRKLQPFSLLNLKGTGGRYYQNSTVSILKPC